MYVCYCDSRVHGSAEFRLGDTVKLDISGGGGGTAFAPAIEHITTHCPDAAAIVYLTDLDCMASRFGREPAAPVLWAAWGRLRAAPWGEVIPLDPHA